MSLTVRSQYRGVTLAETIIACFVLTFAMLVSTALFHTALQFASTANSEPLESPNSEWKS